MVPDMPALPDGPTVIQVAPHCFTVRRLTERDCDVIRQSEYGRWCEAHAERDAEFYGISREEWDSMPDAYRGECFKECHSVQRIRKGSIYEFAVYGVYVCDQCGYAYPPGCAPAGGVG